MKRIFYILLILLSGVHGLSNAQTTIKISELPAADSAIGTDQVPVNQGGTTKRITVTQIRSTLEPALGNPASSGYCLKSTDAGVRSWGACSTDSLPTQTGNSGKFLTTNGSAASWGTPADDQTDAEVTNTSTVSGATVKAALDTLDAGKVGTTTTIGVAYGGTGADLSDPGAHRLVGWNNTSNLMNYVTAGSGLSFDGETLSVDVSAGLGDVTWDGGSDVPVDNEIVRYQSTTGKKIQANTGATLGDDGTLTIPSGALFAISGDSSTTGHSHPGTDVTFTDTTGGLIPVATTASAAINEVATNAAVATYLTSGQLDIARLPACPAQYQMLVCNGDLELDFSTSIPLSSIYDTTYFIDDDDDGRMYVVLGDVPTGVSTAITPFEHINVTVIKPNDLADAQRDAFLVWSNESGKTFTVTEIKCWSDTDDTDLNVEETDADGTNNATIDAIQCTTGSGPYTDTETTITGASVEDTHLIWIDFDDSDTPGYVKCTITGYYTN